MEYKFFFVTFVILLLCEMCKFQELETSNFHQHVQRLYRTHGKEAIKFVFRHLRKVPPHVYTHAKRITNDHVAPRVLSAAKKAVETAPMVIKGTGRLFAKLFRVASYNLDLIPTLDNFLKSNGDDTYPRNRPNTGMDPYSRNGGDPNPMNNNYDTGNQDYTTDTTTNNYAAYDYDSSSAPKTYSEPSGDSASGVDSMYPADSASPANPALSANAAYSSDSDNYADSPPAIESSADSAFAAESASPASGGGNSVSLFIPEASGIQTNQASLSAMGFPVSQVDPPNAAVPARPTYEVTANPGSFPAAGIPAIAQGYQAGPVNFQAAPSYPLPAGFPVAAGFPIAQFPAFPVAPAVQPFPAYPPIAPAYPEMMAVPIPSDPVPTSLISAVSQDQPTSLVSSESAVEQTSDILSPDNANDTSLASQNDTVESLSDSWNSSDAQITNSVATSTQMVIAAVSTPAAMVAYPLPPVNAAPAIYPAYSGAPAMYPANPAFAFAPMNPAAQGIYAPQYIAFPQQNVPRSGNLIQFTVSTTASPYYAMAAK